MNLFTAKKDELIEEAKRLELVLGGEETRHELIAIIKEARGADGVSRGAESVGTDVAATLEARKEAAKEILLATEEDIKTLNIPKKAQTVDGADVEDLVDELNAFFAGRARAAYNRDTNPNMIEFSQGARGPEDLTIHQKKAAITVYAKSYAAPVGNDVGRLEGQAVMPDLNKMTPAQKQDFIAQLREAGL